MFQQQYSFGHAFALKQLSGKKRTLEPRSYKVASIGSNPNVLQTIDHEVDMNSSGHNDTVSEKIIKELDSKSIAMLAEDENDKLADDADGESCRLTRS